jgi:hypothetical protein
MTELLNVPGEQIAYQQTSGPRWWCACPAWATCAASIGS